MLKVLISDSMSKVAQKVFEKNKILVDVKNRFIRRRDYQNYF